MLDCKRKSQKSNTGQLCLCWFRVADVTADTSATPLTAATLHARHPDVSVPDYDRTALRRSIVHIGVGGFHRAHLATYIDDLCATGDTAWAITGAGLLPGDARMRDALASQDFLYTLLSRGATRTDVSVVGSIVDFVLAADDPTPLIALIADPTTQVLSMTITEGGYPVDDDSGRFRPEASLPGGVFDVIARGLEARRNGGGAPLTILSCDNIMENGVVARAATIGAAEQLDDRLVEWITRSVSFPNSMVDRITPVTTPDDIAWLAANLGIVDRWPVVAEPFRQWVIEDDFAGERLPLEKLDVIVTSDIAPYELTKLRLLNAGHSCLAYLAALGGFARVDEAMADPDLRNFVQRFLDQEAKPTLPPAAGIDLDHYIASLIERFSNPGVGDQIARLCLDGTSKFPKFLLPTIRAQLAGNGDIARSALALAGWCEYLASAARDDGPSPAADPLLDVACEHAQRSIDDPGAFLDFAEVFGDDLRRSEPFVRAFTTGLEALRTSGVHSTLTAIA